MLAIDFIDFKESVNDIEYQFIGGRVTGGRGAGGGCSAQSMTHVRKLSLVSIVLKFEFFAFFNLKIGETCLCIL